MALSKKCQIQLLIMTILTNIADIICDWLFFIDIWRLKPGLVYGPPNLSIIYAVLGTAILSSILLLLETLNSIQAACDEDLKSCVNVDYLLLVTVWFADLPVIIVSIIIAACREDPVSIFQLSKASVVLIGMIFKFLMFFITYCSKDERIVNKLCNSIFIGLILNAAGSITIFIFTQTNHMENGGLSITVPQTAFHPVYNNDRYFKNVGVFFNHQSFDTGESGTNFVHLISVNELRSADSNTKFFFNYEYENRGDQINMTFWKKKGDGVWKSGKCYSITKSTNEIKMEKNCETLISSYTESVFITFKFVAPEPVFHTLIIGDISYNLKIKRPNDGCTEDTGSHILQYFRKETTDYLNNDRFYNIKNMEDIKDVWKTGWSNCESSGTVAPNKDENLPTPCSRL